MRCEPRVTRLASGAIVLSHRVGTTREGGDGRPRLVRSDDDGATWRVLASPFTGALPAGWDLRGCALAELADGGLLAVVVAIDKTSGKPPYNPVTEGLVPVRNLVARSDDGGATWSEPWDLADGRYVQHASQGLLALPDGGAPVHVRDVQDLRRPGRLAVHGRRPPLRRRRPDLGSAGDLGGIGPRRRPARHDVVGPADRAARLR